MCENCVIKKLYEVFSITRSNNLKETMSTSSEKIRGKFLPFSGINLSRELSQKRKQKNDHLDTPILSS